MTTQSEIHSWTSGQAKAALSSVNGLLEPLARLSEELAGAGEILEITSLNGLIEQRGKMLANLVGMRTTIHSAIEIAGPNSPEFQYFSELTKKIRISGDILVGVLRKRKEVVINNILSTNNQVKLQTYAR
jgi:hypothetical protein